MSLFQTKNNGKLVWCASYWYVDDFGKRRWIRGYANNPDGAVKARTQNFQKRMMSGLSTSVRATTPTVTEYLETWLSSPHNSRLGHESRRKYRRDIEIHILPHIGQTRLESLTDERLSELVYTDLAATPTSARWHAFKTFGTLLNHAAKKGIIKRNPLTGVAAPTRETSVSADDDKWNDKRLRIAPYLLKWLADPTCDYHEHYPRVAAMFLGLRRAEILGLEWSCVTNLNKPNKASLIIRQQLKRHEKHTGLSGWYIDTKTKNRNDRTIPLPEFWRKLLLEEKKKNRIANEDWAKDLIFITPRGTHTTYNLHAQKWKEILNAYMNKTPGQPIDHFYFRPHAVRHLAASLMFAQNVQLEIAQDILGHSDKAITQYYTHMTRAARLNATDALGTGFGQ